MGKGCNKRILCLLLALQMLCTPIARAMESAAPAAAPRQAQAAAPKSAPQKTNSATPKTSPLPPPTPTQTAPAEKSELSLVDPLAERGPYGSIRAGYGLAPYQAGYKAAGKRNFSLERADAPDQSKVDMGLTPKVQKQGSDWLITPDLPLAGGGQDAVGRMPDREFGGWYVYGTQGSGLPRTAYFDSSTETHNKPIPPKFPLTEAATGVASRQILDLVGRWVPSSNAMARTAALTPVSKNAGAGFTATAQALPLYKEPLAGKAAAELTALQTVFSPEVDTYYLRVPANVEAVDLSFASYEPFADFAATYAGAGDKIPVLAQSPLRVTVTTGDDSALAGAQTEYTERLAYAIQNGGKLGSSAMGGTEYTANNSALAPAHALWTTGKTGARTYTTNPDGSYQIGDSIPLLPSAGAGKYYNIIKVCTTAPDGKTQKTYTFYVQRLADPVMRLAPGNTPAGMIARDSSGTWGKTPEQIRENKKTAFTYLSTYQNFNFTGGIYPSGAENNQGVIFHDGYYNQAWIHQNYDLDERAIVAYEDRSFEEPGLELWDSEGNKVGFGDGSPYAAAVQRTRAFLLVDRLAVSAVAGSGIAGEREERVTEPVLASDGRDSISLEQKLVRPGIYSLDYSFTDPISGLEYQSDGKNFYRGKPSDFSRPLLVLPIPGDVDMDGAVTIADAVALDAIVTAGNAGLLGQATTDARAALYLFRVCNVNADMAVDAGDVKKLLDGYLPKQTDSARNCSDYAYLPLPGGKEPTRKPMPAVPPTVETNKAQLTLDYLGKNTEALTNATRPTEGVLSQSLNRTDGLELGDVFWVGVHLKDTKYEYNPLYQQNVTGFTGTVTYDAQYVEPVAVLSAADDAEMKNAGISSPTPRQAWQWSMRKYNLGKASETFWGSDHAYHLSGGSAPDREYAPHYSKATTTLKKGETGLRELVFSVTANPQGGKPFATEGGYLTFLPFRLVSHPYGAQTGHFMELGMGMRDLAFTSAPLVGGFALGGQRQTTTAWSMQETIFGGTTQNASGAIQYRGGDGMDLKLGANKTDWQLLANEGGKKTVYGEPFQNRGMVPANGDYTALPPGLTYDGALQMISGIPEQAGTHTFYVGGKPYKVVVEKAPITLTATDASKYYGEEIYCGTDNQALVFTYDPLQIKPLDKNRPGAANSGTMADLAGLLGNLPERGYSAPTRTAYVDSPHGSPLAKQTPVGKYSILIEGAASRDYAFSYVGGMVTVLPRPIVVNELHTSPVGTVYQDGSGLLQNLAASTVISAGHPVSDFTTTRAPKLSSDAAGEYNGLVLSAGGMVAGDGLALLYDAVYVQTQADKQAQAIDGEMFQVAAGATEDRAVRIQNIRMTASERSGNYALKAEEPTLQTATGKVTERALTTLAVTAFPEAARAYTYGTPFNVIGALQVTLCYGSGTDAKEVQLNYTPKAFEDAGLNLCWVTADQIAAGELGEATPATHNEQLHVQSHSGKYLCVWRQWQVQGQTVTVKAYTKDFAQDAFITVLPKPLTLTMENQARYYGEENATLAFQYNLADLANWDRKLGQTGAMTELDKGGLLPLEGYTRPKMSAMTALVGGTAVTAGTAVTNTDCYLKISGGAASDYSFRYTENNGAAQPPVSESGGYGTLRIHKRPLIVDAVDQTPVGTLYADTVTPALKGLKLTFGTGAQTFTAMRPVSATYYTATAGMDGVKMTMNLTGNAVYGADALGLVYDADFLGDKQDAPYFTTGSWGEKTYDVKVKSLRFDQDFAKVSCYELVYGRYTDAAAGLPYARTDATAACAKGKVRLRPLTGLAITRQPSLSLTYGEELLPQRLVLRATYETLYENDPQGNAEQITQKVYYGEQELKDRGLKVYYQDAGGNRKALKFADEYPVVKQTGSCLVVAGQIPHTVSASDHTSPAAEVCSDKTGALTVKKANLTLTVEKQYRFYGEPNATYRFSAQRAELALPDRSKFLSATLTGSANDAETNIPKGKTDLGLLAGYNEGLHFTTQAQANSAVLGGGYSGYPLTLSGGASDNYGFTYENAEISPLKRPISIQKVTKNPVFTVYPAQTEDAARSYPGIVLHRADFTAARASASYHDDEIRQITGADLPLAMSDFALYGADGADLSATVTFPKFPTEASFSGNTIELPWDVTVGSLALVGGAENNYRLTATAPGDKAAKARVDMRQIDKIEVVGAPDLKGYTYGQSLNLTDLTLKITYKTHPSDQGGAAKTEEVPYGQRDNVFVSYWPAAVPLPTEADESLVGAHRAAKHGDHLTIAPVHTEPGKPNIGDPDFAANGMYLVVSARTADTLPYVAPKLVATAATGDNPIKVAPLKLTYELAAEDKIYDGTTDAAGTLRLTNAYNRQGITDFVYVAVGGEYESADMSKYNDFLAYLTQRPDGPGTPMQGYRFHATPEKAGMKFSYIFPNVRYSDATHASGDAVLPGDNWWKTEPPAKTAADGDWDTYGGITSMPVEVRDIHLAGPDAANYTWESETVERSDTQVLLTTRDMPQEGQAAVPYATISKATYPKPLAPRPTVEVDRHSNAARLMISQSLPAYPLDSRYGSELHYEYALETLARTDGAEIAYQLGTKNAYQDTQFFGGEPVAVAVPPGYVPEDALQKPPGENDVVKGQTYLWAAEDPGFGLDGSGQPLRDPIPRDSSLWGRMRLAETHNYLPSAPIYTIEDDAPTALSPVLRAGIQAAQDRADAESAQMADSDSRPPDKDHKDPLPVKVAVGKAYAQRLDLISTEQKSGKDDRKQYMVSALESVWFTDLLRYAKRENMDRVVRNAEPVRYYGYFWDVDHSAALAFDKAPLDLSDKIEGIEIIKKTQGSPDEKQTITVNQNHIAQIYAAITPSSGGGVVEESIKIQPAFLDAALGDAPVALTVKFFPGIVEYPRIRWSSSNEKVATISEKGLVTFVGVGETEITATSYYKKTDHITVRVVKAKDWVDPEAGIFNFYMRETFFTLDRNRRFYPEHVMTRGELAVTLADFVKKNERWTGHGSGIFPDLDPKSPYAPAAKLMGKLGIINGRENVGFAADETATRAEFIVMLARMMAIEVPDTKGKPHAFEDSGEEQTWAYAYIDAMAAMGIAKGTGNGCFYPNRPITKAEVAALLVRLLRFQAPPEGWNPELPGDIAAGNWAYDPAVRAVNDLVPHKAQK